MKLKIDKNVFKFIARPNDVVYSIQIKKGRYKNVIYNYGPVKFEEDKESGQLKFNFEFAISEGNSRYSKEELFKSEKFKNFVADILVYIMEEDLAAQLEEKLKNDEFAEIDTQENL